MKFLANENVAGDAVTALREKGHDVVWIRSDAPGTDDTTILARAVEENRILITFDKDFGVGATLCGRPDLMNEQYQKQGNHTGLPLRKLSIPPVVCPYIKSQRI